MNKIHYTFFYGFLTLCISIQIGCKGKKHLVAYVADTDVKYYRISNQEVASDDLLDKMITPYRDSMDIEMNQIIGHNPELLEKKKPHSKLGNLMTDIMVEEAELLFEKEVDFAVQNYGGIRIPALPAGNITKGKIFELMPFDNMLVLLTMDSSLVHQLCNRIAENGGWPMSDGINFSIQDTTAVHIKIDGKPLNGGQSYYVAMPDYIAGGGDSCFFLEGAPLENSGAFIREILINNIMRNTAKGIDITPNPSKRLIKLNP